MKRAAVGAVAGVMLAGLWCGLAWGQGRTGELTQAQEALVRGNRAYEAKRYKEAEESYRRALNYDPTLVEPAERLAAIYYEQGRHAEAVRLLRRALSANPGNGRLEAWLGLHLLKMKREREAVALLQKAVRKDYKLFLAQLKLGAYYFKHRRWQEAITAFWNYLKFRPKTGAGRKLDATVNRFLGIAYLRLGKYPQAQTRFLAALALRPKYWKAELELAEVYVHRGFCPRALSIFRKYRKYTSRRPRFAYLEALCHFKVKAKERALAALRRYLKSRPRSVKGHLLKGDVYYYFKDYDKALLAYERAVSLDRGSMLAAVKYGKALMGLRMYAKAKKVLQQVASRAPNSPQVLLGLGQACLGLKDYRSAAGYLRKLVAVAPRDVAGWTSLGRAYLKLKRIADALDAFKRAMRLSKGTDSAARSGLVAALNASAYEALKAGNVPLALERLRRAYGLDRHRLMTLRNLGLVLLVAKQYAEARKYLAMAKRKVPRDLVVNRLLGRVALALGQLESARAHYVVARQAAYRLGGVVLGEILVEFAAVLAKMGRTEDAVVQLRDAVLTTGGAPEVNRLARKDLVQLLLAQASAKIQEGKGSEVVGACQEAVKYAKGLGEMESLAKFFLALAYLDAAQWAKAMRLFRALARVGGIERVLKPPFDKLGLRFFEAYAAYREGRYGYAEGEFRKLMRRSRGKLRKTLAELIRSCREFQATALLRQGKTGRAAAAIRALGPRTRESRHNLALAWYRLGRVAKAVAVWSGPGMPPEAACNLGVHYDRIGRPAEAFKFYVRCVRRGGGNAEIRRRIDVKRRIFGFK